MDSPPPRSHHPTKDYQSNHPPSTTLSLSKWVHSINPFLKALRVAVLSSLFAALVFSSLPLWRPIAALLLQKLMDFLKFLFVTVGIGLGILNIQLWRSNYTESDSVCGNGGKDDSVSSRVPFVGMFSGEMQHSYSFDEKEMEVTENGLMSRRETENDGGHDADTATMTAIAEADDDDEQNTPHISMPVMDSTSGLPIKENVAHERDDSLAKSTAQHDIKEDGARYEEAAFGPSVHVPATITMNLTTKTKVKPYDDLGLAAVVAQQPSKIIHRRGSSLDFRIEKEWRGSKLGNYAATDQQCNLEVHQLSPSRKVAPSALDMIDHATTVEPGRKKASESSTKSNTGAGFPAASTSTPKHNRSRSVYDLNELLVQQRPRNKSGTTSSQLSKRRNTSLSCDLDKDYSNGGVPAWLLALPSPPEPPLVYGYDNNEKRVETREFDTRKSEGQDESTLRKAFSESLAPWRATTNALPVEIPISNKETKGLGDFSHRRTESHGAKHTRVLTPSSSPSTPNSSNTMGSPSPGELNKKVDAFIARFHQQMRLQRLESLERFKQRGY